MSETTAEQPAPEEETTETKKGSGTEIKKSGDIPGFPLESIVISIVLAALMLWLSQRRH